MRKYNFAIVGATGMVGETFLKVLEERNLPIDKLFLFSSKRSAGKVVKVLNREIVVEELKEDSFIGRDIHFALFSAGGETSKKFAPLAAKEDIVVIDNSSAFRMYEDIPLVVPEVNIDSVKESDRIIANPNCSTIQSVLPLKVFNDLYGIKRVVYSTYQAVSGSGVKGVLDLKEGLKGNPPVNYPHPIAFNCLPHIDSFLENGYTKEEEKMVNETRKILNLPNLKVTATCVRVPVLNGHSVSMNVELMKDFDLEELKAALKNSEGIVLYDDVEKNIYPMATVVSGKDEIYVGRIRRDMSLDFGINMWVVGDNIRKGAATNAVQIAEELIKRREK